MLKNWFRLFYILICATGIILYVVLLARMPKGAASFSLVCYILAPLFFFIGTIVYNALKYFDKTKNAPASYAQLAAGLIVVILFSIGASSLFGKGGIGEIIANNSDIKSSVAKYHEQVLVSIAYFGQLIVFGLMPLVKGISKTIATSSIAD